LITYRIIVFKNDFSKPLLYTLWAKKNIVPFAKYPEKKIFVLDFLSKGERYLRQDNLKVL